MMTILYILLIYALLGSITYLIGQIMHTKNKKILLIYYYLVLIFGIVIDLIIFTDEFIIPTIKNKVDIFWVKRKYNKFLKIKDLTDNDKQLIIKARDEMVRFLSNSDGVQDEE
jgi:cytochrome c biogenesis protein CcdA